MLIDSAFFEKDGANSNPVNHSQNQIIFKQDRTGNQKKISTFANNNTKIPEDDSNDDASDENSDKHGL